MSIDKEIEEYELEMIKMFLFINEKRYSLKTIGIEAKTIFDWTNSGLLIDEKPEKGRRKYNVIEFVWIQMLVELRKFGLSHEALRVLKSTVMKEYKITEIIKLALSDELDEELEGSKNSKRFQKRFDYLKTLNIKASDYEELQEFFDSQDFHLTQTTLGFLILGGLIERINYHILIKFDGTSLITAGEPWDSQISMGDILNAPYISFPLSNVLSLFFSKEDLIPEEAEDQFDLLTEGEQKVLELLRQGNVVSLSVRLGKDNQINLIETEEEINHKDVSGTLADYIMRNSYQEITYKTQKGKITSLKRKTKHKI